MKYDKEKTFDKAEQKLEKKEKPKKKSWGDYFTEPIETIYIQMGDNKTWKYTSHEKGEIDLNTQALQMWLKKVNKAENKDYNIGNIKMILHNHLKNSKFSDRDYRTHRDLKGHGFKGHFLMYSNLSKKLYDINKVDPDKKQKKPKEIKKENQLDGRSSPDTPSHLGRGGYGQGEETRKLLNMVATAKELREKMQRQFNWG